MDNDTFLEEIEREWQNILHDLDKQNKDVLPVAGIFHRIRPTVLFFELQDVISILHEVLTPDLKVYSERYINSSWTVRNLIAHLASWASELRSEIEIFSRNEEPDYVIPYALSIIGPIEWNEREVMKRHSKSLEEVSSEFELHCKSLQDLILNLTVDFLNQPRKMPFAPSGDANALFTGNVAQVTINLCSHFRMHLLGLQAWHAQILAERRP